MFTLNYNIFFQICHLHFTPKTRILRNNSHNIAKPKLTFICENVKISIKEDIKKRGILLEINIAVCDDNETELAKITKQVHTACSEMNIAARIRLFRSGEEFLASNADRECGIIFMDIYLDGINGMDAVRRLASDSLCHVIFITTSTDHAIEAFNLNAAHYLVKPTNIESISEAIKRCIPKGFDKNGSVLEIKTGKVMVSIPIKNILYIEVMDKYCAIHTENGTFKTLSSLASLYERLDDRFFMKPQQSYVINMAAIEKFNFERIILCGGKDIPLSRKKRAELQKQYQSFLFRLARGEGIC